MKQDYDVIIVGGGLVGATFALALAKQTNLKIAILESLEVPNFAFAKQPHHRVSAISLASQQIFQALGVWEQMMSERCALFDGLSIWDESVALHFESRDIAKKQLGFIVENNIIQQALFEEINKTATISYFTAIKLLDLSIKEHYAELLTEQRKFSAKLIVAADGAHSWIREKSNISRVQHDYKESAIVATVRTENPHQHIARQVFLASGPLAFLPLADAYYASIVWSLQNARAKQLMSLAAIDFNRELSSTFSHLGDIKESSERHIFPLTKHQADHYIAPRIALIGDAAHVVHPLAGQGVNMGLLDATALAEVMTDALTQSKDFSNSITLGRYQRWRKTDNLAMVVAIDQLKKIFATQKMPLKFLRQFGLKACHHLPWIKNLMMRYAVGDFYTLPRLVRSHHTTLS